MLELIHAVITSLLLSATVGGGVDKQAQADEEPASSETGIDVGKLPSHLVSPRSLTKAEQGDDDQPDALDVQVSFCEPTPWAECTTPVLQAPPQALLHATAGRSP
jgi:hypothetical protein